MTEKVQNRVTHIVVLVVAVLATVGVLSFIFLGDSNDSEPKSVANNETVSSAEDSQESQRRATVNEGGTVISYRGEDGKKALELLKELAEPTTEESDFGEFVTAINGVDGGGTKFWLFYVDDEAATVGAGDYETTDGQTIEWRLE